jgi:hypothetical protein
MATGDWLPIATGTAIAVTSSVVSWITTRGERKVDAAGELTESALAIVRELRVDVAALKAEHADCQRHLEALVAHLRRVGVPFPDEEC